MMRAIFWGLALWGLISLVLPTTFLYFLLMTLGTLALIGVCIGLTAALFEWLENNFDFSIHGD